ncbi:MULTISPECIES: aromatic acid/H+ symport family MFS transporter [unclassified Enterococcus]|uniref:MFS transporter n=1 Tax=unclassified Enterococcus TaxID=2608891 RepID=UPI00259BD93B|nr:MULTISPECIES: aromatic acid/H+ symport family MFS transporter [unclassified Enterococcus]MDO0919952.1 aromatic acid/H+ symport family MFS transporter [Enterococcus sp. B1E2]WIV15423.1 aromatic acid/H+ symport family MFS transporter [Enterococcus sp. FZMF]
MNQKVLNSFLDNSKFNGFHKVLLAIGFFVITFSGYELSVFGSIVPVVIKEWNISTTQVGFIGSSAMFGMMLGAILLSFLADKFGVKKLLIVSIFIFNFFIVCATFTNSGLMFGICRFMAGVGSGGATPIVISLLTEYSPKANKAKMVAFAICGNQIGGILAPLVAMNVMPQFGWKPVLWFSILPLLLIPVFIKVIPESARYLSRSNQIDKLNATLTKIDPNYQEVLESNANTISVDAEDEKNAEKVSYLKLFNKQYALGTVLITLIYICGLLTINGVNVWLPQVMNSNGYALGSSLTFSVVLNLGTLLGTVLWAIMVDKVGFRVLMPIIYSVGAISLFGMGIKANLLVLYLFVGLIGMFAFSAHSLMNTFASQYYPAEIRTTGVGFANATGRIGGMLGPIVGGMLLTANVSITMWFLVFAIPGLVAAISITLINIQTKYLKQKDSVIAENTIVEE